MKKLSLTLGLVTRSPLCSTVFGCIASVLACSPVDTVVGSNVDGAAGSTDPTVRGGGTSTGGAPGGTAASGGQTSSSSSGGNGSVFGGSCSSSDGLAGTIVENQSGCLLDDAFCERRADGHYCTGSRPFVCPDGKVRTGMGSCGDPSGGAGQGGGTAAAGTSQSGGAATAGSSGQACPAGQSYLEPPGCPTEGRLPLAKAGCYAGCTGAADASCPTGTLCQARQTHPCPCANPNSECCAACAEDTWVCLPQPTQCDFNADDSRILAAEHSYSECGGYCDELLQLSPSLVGAGDGCDRAILAVTNRDDSMPIITNLGLLTPLAHERTRSIALTISESGTELQSVYDCPDCADGGKGILTLRLEGATSTHAFDIGLGAPPVLAAAHEFTLSIINAMQTCTSNEYVSIDASACTPVPR